MSVLPADVDALFLAAEGAPAQPVVSRASKKRKPNRRSSRHRARKRGAAKSPRERKLKLPPSREDEFARHLAWRLTGSGQLLDDVKEFEIQRLQRDTTDRSWSSIGNNAVALCQMSRDWHQQQEVGVFIEDPVQRRAHVCSGDCSWFVRGDLFVCNHSGSVHLCTAVACEEVQVTHNGERVCALTGAQYGREFYSGISRGALEHVTIDQRMYGKKLGAHSIQRRIATTRRAVSELSQKPVTTDKADLQQKQLEQKRRELTELKQAAVELSDEGEMRHIFDEVFWQMCFSPQRQRVNDDRLKASTAVMMRKLKGYISTCTQQNMPITGSVLMHIFASEQAHLMRHNAASTGSKDEFKRLAPLAFKLCMAYWGQVRKLEDAREMKYAFHHHVLVFLILSGEGVRTQTGLYVLPPWPDLARLLPAVKDLVQLGIKSSIFSKHRAFTRAQKAFKNLLNQLADNGQLIHPPFHPGLHLISSLRAAVSPPHASP